jgi:branched-chain amino acid transport system ATP-binding protein
MYNLSRVLVHMLTLDNIHTYYGDSHILQGISLHVAAGQVVSLLGRNGAGKTTTINTIVGFTPARAGTITFKGRDITRAPTHVVARLGMGLVPQGRRLFPNLTVEENILLAARPGAHGADWTLDRIYQTFPILRERINNSGAQLSGGEQQMLAIARALATNPEMILFDEPSEGLAPLIVAEIGRIIVALKQQGFAILLVEQHFAMAMAVADQVYVMNKGQIVFHGDPATLQANEELKHKYLGI